MLLAFTLLAVLILVSAIWVVTLRNLFRAALSLGVVLVGVAVLFLLLEAEFLAFVQILVYVGAILTLVIFAIMLTAKLTTPQPPLAAGRRGLAAATSAALFFVLNAAAAGLAASKAANPQAVSIQELGQQLVTTLVLPFEVISLVFVAVMVGAITLAVERKPDSRARS